MNFKYLNTKENRKLCEYMISKNCSDEVIHNVVLICDSIICNFVNPLQEENARLFEKLRKIESMVSPCDDDDDDGTLRKFSGSY